MSNKKVMLVALVTTMIVLISSSYLVVSLFNKSNATNYNDFNKIVFENKKEINNDLNSSADYNDGQSGEAIIETEPETEPQNTAPIIIQRISVGNGETTSTLTIIEPNKKEESNNSVENSFVPNNPVPVEVPIVNETKPATPVQNESAPKAPVQSQTTQKKVVSTMPYYIKINNSQNVVNIYTKDADGNYTVPYKAMICSTGTSTPKAGNKYKITTYRRTWNGLKGNVYGQYAVQIVGNILFHSVPYTAKNKSSLEYWEYDKLGTKASMGCIRLTVEDAKWIYDNVGAGTWVEFYEDSNPGPFGKPVASKISSNEACRNWDPTDYVPENPWYSQDEPVPVESTIVEAESTNQLEESKPILDSTPTTSLISSGENIITITSDINVNYSGEKI